MQVAMTQTNGCRQACRLVLLCLQGGKGLNYAWAPRGQIPMNGVPTVVLEVGVFNETEEELLAVGSEWLDLPTTQVCYHKADYA